MKMKSLKTTNSRFRLKSLLPILFTFLILWTFSLSSFLSNRIVDVKVENVIQSLRDLEEIAERNGGSRSIVNGHNDSASYIIAQLSPLKSLDIFEQVLNVPVQVDEEAPVLGYYKPSDGEYTVFEPRKQLATVSGSGSCFLSNTRVVTISSCDSQVQWKRIPKQGDWIALINPQTTSCNPCDSLITAIHLGAKGAIVVNQPGNQQGYPFPLPPRPQRCYRYPKYRAEMMRIGVVSLSDDAAVAFLSTMAEDNKLRVDLKVVSAYRDYITRNVIATSKAGNASSIVLFGSHLDSVPVGPGVNDDGSGASATLELARAFDSSTLAKTTKNKVQFAWWTAEEIGLLGSRFYVKNLTDNHPDILSSYMLNIDTDMIASPNYVRGVWSGSELKDPLKSKTAIITKLISDYFAKQGLPIFEFKFNGRSDFQPFLDAGIPCGGVITGEDEIKSIESAKLFGGISGMVLDPCYHQDCDRVSTLEGSGFTILKQNVDVLGYLLETFAQRQL